MSRPAPRPTVVVAVAVGGSLGALVRWALGDAFPAGPGVFPWTTFGINVIGSTLLALVAAVAAVRSRPVLVGLLGPGVLGGFTTLSTYSEESRALLADGHVALAASYVVGTLVACLAAVVLTDLFSSTTARSEFHAAEGDT